MNMVLKLPERVIINDCTLREGEQFSGLSVDEKIMLARAIDDIGLSAFVTGRRETNSGRVSREVGNRPQRY